MKCPLLCLAKPLEITHKEPTEADCLKEECAWWLEDISMCALKDLALETRYIQFRLQDMLAKMPHEEQFRK